VSVAITLSFSCSLFGQDVPSLAPVVTSVFPHGAQQGSISEVAFIGQNLGKAISLQFVGSGVRGEILSSSTRKLLARITVSASAEVGRRDFRLRTNYGSSVGVFDIGSLPETREVEPNDSPRDALAVSSPVVVNGVVDTEDFDHFRIRVAEDEALFFDVNAARNGSKLDADLALLDGQGRELAWSDDDYIYGDPHIEYRFEKSGTYVVRVGSLTGSPTSDYRLVIGRVPYVNLALPAGLRRGSTNDLLIRGSFLEDASRVWLGDHLAHGRILGRSSDAIRVRMKVPEHVPLGQHWLHLSSPRFETPLPMPLVVSDVPETSVLVEPLIRQRAMKIEAPVAVNGILVTPRASHYFRFKAAAQQRFQFQVDSMEFGYHLDPAITLFDDTGRKLDFADDPGRDDRTDETELDPHFSYRFEKDGEYLLAIRDSMYRGDARFVYRLTIRPAHPDFILEVREPLKTAYPGEETSMLLRVRRTAGWDTPVEVWAEGLPVGVSSERLLVEAKNSIVKDTCGVDHVVDGSIVMLPIRIRPDATLGLHCLTIKARGAMEGRTVEHDALAFYEQPASNNLYGPMQQQRVALTIAPPPSVILDVPDELTLEAGKSAQLKLLVSRFRDAKELTLLLSAPELPGAVALETAELKPKMREAALRFIASPDAKTSKLPIRITAISSGKVVAESPPFVLKVVAGK